MKSKKIFALTMACMMGLGAFAGCAKKKDEILNWKFFAAMFGSEINDGNEIQELIAKDTGIRVKESWLTGQTSSEAIGSIVASGDLPEFIDGGDGSEDLYKAGYLVAWDDYLAKPEFANLKEMYTDKEWEMFKHDGHIYWANVFNNSYKGKPVSHGYNDEAFWIQVRVLEWDNYPIIETLDEYFDLLERYYKENQTNEDGTKIIPYTALCEDWRYFCIENAPEFLDGYPNDGSVIVNLDNPDAPKIVDYNTTPTAKRYFAKLNEVYNKGLMDPEFAIQTYDEYMAKLSTGAVLGMCDQWWDFAGTVNENFKANKLDEKGYNYVPLGPTIDKGMTNRWYIGATDTLNSASGIAVTTSCKDPDKAFKFLNRMLDQDMHNLRFWGIEGVDYLKKDSGEFYRTQEMRDKWADANYTKSHCCMYSYFPQYGGMSRDGINTMQPGDSNDEFFAGMAEPLKKCFERYGYTAYNQFLRSTDGVVGIWYPMYQFSNNLKTDTEAGVAWTKMGETKHTWLPQIVVAKDFESEWNKYMEAYAACQPEVFLAYMQETLDNLIKS
ncbi:MAG: sugar ABC transporter substrate-binding protein [Clostridiales bacterium]|nr:sugar ABC transporter substrate-binding protein [Clostridiales bacterium]